jgi:hypothetical protein
MQNGNLSFYGSIITRIENSGFHGSGVLHVYIPPEFDYVRRFAFTQCKKLININNQQPFQKSPFLTLDGTISLINLTIGQFDIIKNRVLDYTGTGITSIDSHDFENCDIIEAILPESVLNLFSGAFSGSTLRKISLGSNIRFASYSIFENCFNLYEIYVGGKRILGDGVFDLA